jgi:hypothetical protein
VIDTNVYLFRWPFRRWPEDDPAELVERLRQQGVTQAWAGSFEGLLDRDIAGVNARLAAACRQHGPNFLLPFGSINPKLPDWQEDARRCVETHHMAGIRLYPSFHGYTLDDLQVADLLAVAANRRLMVQIALTMEDNRMQSPLLRVPPVDPLPLADLVKRMPDLRLMLINAGYQGTLKTPHIPEVAKAGSVYFDIARSEGVGAIPRLIAQTSPSRVVFGSLYPYFYFESSVLKVYEAALPEEQEHALLEGNARAFLQG